MTEEDLGETHGLAPILEATTPMAELYMTAESQLRLGGLAAQSAHLDSLASQDRELYLREFSNFHVQTFGD